MVPKCTYFGKCGGCNSQHISYELQLENKRKNVEYTTKFEGVQVFSGQEYGYRNRMDFIFHEKGLGFRARGKWWKVVDIKNCSISTAKINMLLKEVAENFLVCDYFDLKKQQGTFRYCVIRAIGKTSSISFVLNSDSVRLADAIDKVKRFSSRCSANNIVIVYVPSVSDMSIGEEYFIVKGEDTLSADILGKKLNFHSQGFFQNNSLMAIKMHEYVSKLLEPDKFLLDLYGGVGAFGIVNAKFFEKVVTVESFAKSSELAKNNIIENQLKNVTALCLDAKQIRKAQVPRDSVVITDPPRSGMHPRTISYLNAINPKKIIYISCNPTQLGKELPNLSKHKVKSVAMFDLFPQTNHCEVIVELVREDKKFNT
jgi:tRNA (uracil-5-)-methyltransferase